MYVTIEWDRIEDADGYNVYWSDADRKGMEFRCISTTLQTRFTLHKPTHIPHYFKVALVRNGEECEWTKVLATPPKKGVNEQ